MKNTAFSIKKTLNIKGQIIDLSTPLVMGILNSTPDSFYDGGVNIEEKSILFRAEKILSEGAGILDLGGYSTRPGATPITEKEELKRLIPALKLILNDFPDCILSIDTFRSEVARICMEEGASMINDVSCLSDEKMIEVSLHYNTPYILMHSRGTPETMMQLNNYDNLINDIIKGLLIKVKLLNDKGVKDIIIDPGFGFAKNIEQNFKLLEQLDALKIFNLPLLVGLSRKSMIFKSLRIDVSEALNGTTILNTIAILKGASFLRVHDVKEAVQIISLISKSNLLY